MQSIIVDECIDIEPFHSHTSRTVTVQLDRRIVACSCTFVACTLMNEGIFAFGNEHTEVDMQASKVTTKGVRA